MIAIPAVDVKDGRCVQLVGGRPDDEKVSLPDPVAVARRWWEAGFGALHVVDLDAALDRGANRALVHRIVAATPAEVQVGGGIRDRESVEELLDAGARRVVVGTRAVRDPEWFEEIARARPERVVVAADVRDGEVVVRGWTEGSGIRLERLLERLEPLPVAGILCTDVGREGRLAGIRRQAVRRMTDGTDHAVWISGGIRSLDELAFLAEVGIAGAVLGMALYTETIDIEAAAKEYGR